MRIRRGETLKSGPRFHIGGLTIIEMNALHGALYMSSRQIARDLRNKITAALDAYEAEKGECHDKQG